MTGFIAALMHFAAKLKPHKVKKSVRRTGGAGVMGRQDKDHEAVWRRAILMGDKCQPLDFSGVICYDENGQQIVELPYRSPRRSPFPRSPLPGYLQAK